MYKVRVLQSIVITSGGSSFPVGKGAVIEVTEEQLRDLWQLMEVLEAPENEVIEPATPITAERISRKAVTQPKETRTKK